jgi:dTDP-4-amino-4,6-dideoxygalactose transaminase
MTNGKPAILGNAPVFDNPVRLVQPVLPRFDEMTGEVQGILASGMVTKGSHLRAFEEAVAAHLGVKHAVAVSSCTTGLMLAYQGLGLTGDVVVPSFTFMATVSALVWAGLRPVFADVDPESATLDPAAAEAAITAKTSAIVAVHTFGNPAEMDALKAIADRHRLKLILDAAHGFGTLYHKKPVGAQGNAQAFSLSPTKLLIAGEGGIVSTQDDTLAETIRVGREYGNQGNYDSRFAGINARMPEFNACLGLHSLRGLEEAARQRNAYAARFREELGLLPGIGFQKIRPGDRCSYKDFSLTVDGAAFGVDRDGLAVALAAENIDSRKYYDPPVHRQTAYRQWAPAPERLPHTDLLAATSLSIPIWSFMTEPTVRGICQAVRRIHQHAREVATAVKQAPVGTGA